jgi:hypothetical protein
VLIGAQLMSMSRLLLLFLLAVLLASCAGDESPASKGSDAAVRDQEAPRDVIGASCTRLAECDNGIFCDGIERCESMVCVAADQPSCGGGRCDEANDRCIFP